MNNNYQLSIINYSLSLQVVIALGFQLLPFRSASWRISPITSMVLRKSGRVELVRLLADSRRFLRSPYYSNVVRAFFVSFPKEKRYN